MDVKTLCLAVLHRGDATGYEIKKAFEEGPFSHFQRASYGSIYPALSRLLSEGLAEAEALEQSGRPDKKVYRITPAGRAALIGALNAEPEGDVYRSDFMFLMFFALELPTERVDSLIRTFAARYGAAADHIAGCKAERAGQGIPLDPGREFVSGLGICLYRAAADYLDANRQQLLTELRSRRSEAAE